MGQSADPDVAAPVTYLQRLYGTVTRTPIRQRALRQIRTPTGPAEGHHASVMTDADDRWDCCYVLVEDRSAAEVAALLGGCLGDPQGSERDAARSSAAWPAVGPAGGGWTVLVDPHFEFGDAQYELRDWSRGTRVACLLVIERELFSHALVWVDGELVWQVSFEGALDDRPLAGGQLPFDPDVLAHQLGPVDDPRTWYRVPVAAVERLTG